MKILKKFLLIGLCSFVCIINANASVDYYNFEYYDYDPTNLYLSWSDAKKKEFVNNLESLISFDNNDYEYYFKTLKFAFYDNSHYKITLRQAVSNNKFFIVPGYYIKNTDIKVLYIFQNAINGLFTQSQNFLCDTNLSNCEHLSSSSISNGTYLSYTVNQSDNTLSRWIYDTNQETFDYLSPPDLGQTGYNFSNSYGALNSFSIDNQKTFYLNEEISSVDLIGNFFPFEMSSGEENTCDRTAVLGVVSNVSDITLNVKGETSALAEPLKGTFTLNYSKDYAFTSDDFVIEFVNDSEVGVVGNYNFKCDEVSYNCYLNYEYNTEDDITETANFSFKISMANNSVIPFIKIYACTTNDDYTYISYDYTNGPTNGTTNNPSLDNYLNDLTPPSSDISSLGNIQGILPEGPVDGLLNIPFKVISILIDGFNGTCNPISFRFVFDMPLTFPCVGDELYDHMDSTLMLFVNIVPTAFILIKWFKNLYVRVQRATSLETTTDDEWGGI